jgi:hypothetical protein
VTACRARLEAPHKADTKSVLPDVKLCLDQYAASNARRFLEAVSAEQLIPAITVAEAKQLLQSR